MSDINKLVAAILAAGRVPTMVGSPRPTDDWLAEYNMWVETLDKQDGERAKSGLDESLKGAIG